jgi:Flp pilus assembly protein TadG
MKDHGLKRSHNSRGQSLVETAIMLPLLILLLLNVVNMGYFFLVSMNLEGAARSAGLYSIEGSYTPYGQEEAPSGTATGSALTTTAGTVAYTIYQDLTGAVWNPTASSTKIQVCTQVNVNSTTASGLNTQSSKQLANCMVCDSSNGCAAANTYAGSPPPAADPEQPNFILNEVDIWYQFNTLFPGRIFNVPLDAAGRCNSGTCVFSQQARMRSMGP